MQAFALEKRADLLVTRGNALFVVYTERYTLNAYFLQICEFL